MLNRRNGFTLIEVIAAATILMNVIAVAAPITATLIKEKTVLSERRLYTNVLHDELQVYLWEKSSQIPDSFSKRIRDKKTTFQFEMEYDYVKGCIHWKNAKQVEDAICLYGLPE